MEWSQEKVIHLIELYRARRILWDASMKEYKDRNKRHDALIEIAKILEVDKGELEKKIRYLQSHFARELKQQTEARE